MYESELRERNPAFMAPHGRKTMRIRTHAQRRAVPALSDTFSGVGDGGSAVFISQIALEMSSFDISPGTCMVFPSPRSIVLTSARCQSGVISVVCVYAGPAARLNASIPATGPRRRKTVLMFVIDSPATSIEKYKLPIPFGARIVPLNTY
jgi:hypothetical protein